MWNRLRTNSGILGMRFWSSLPEEKYSVETEYSVETKYSSRNK